ncbi:MAG: ATP-binding protein [Aliiglaciecola sp.]|uniref:ATP-binding protein n=1 Tax=Aliiglaciecola sp. TaxID=1872441 RepID=UPI00329776D0
MYRYFPSLLISIIVSLVIFAVSVIIYQRISEQEELVSFYNPAQEYVEVTQERILFAKFPLKSLQHFYESSTLINAQEFKQFTSAILESFPATEMVAWLPKVESTEELIILTKEVGTKLEGSALMRAQEMAKKHENLEDKSYFPLTLWNSAGFYEKQLKDIIWNQTLIKDALQQSLQSGKPSASVPFFVGDENESSMVLVALPLYKKPHEHKTFKQREDNNSGFIVIVFDIRMLLGNYFISGVAENLKLFSTHTFEPQLVYQSKVGDLTSSDDTASFTSLLSVADKTWQLVITREGNSGGGLYLIIPILAFFIGFCLIYLHIKQINSAAMCNEKNTALENLKFAQDKLIESEKISAMGGVVAGISHEVNTPLGVSITAISHLIETVDDLDDTFQQGTLDKDKFEDFIEAANDLSKMALKNLHRAAKLMTSFKRISVDQTKDGLDEINVRELLEELFINFELQYKDINFDVSLDCDPTIVIRSYPSAFLQIISALVANSMLHGFKDSDHNNHIKISVRLDVQEQHHVLRYSDNGHGVDETLLSKIFEPFYTTNRGAGNAGLGLSVVNNLIKQKLHGELSYGCEDKQGFWIEFSLINHQFD